MIVRELLAKFGVAYDDSGAKKADKDVEGLSGGFRALIGVVGGAALVRGMGRFIVQQVELADAVGDTAERLGVSVEALQELRFAGQDVGVSIDGVDGALARLVRGSAEAAKGQGESKAAFKELGVSLTDGSGNLRDFDDILSQVADGLGNAKTDADRLRLGFAVFGREGSKFAATLKGGSAGIEEMRQKARELGGVLSREQVDAADKADKAINGFALALGGLKHQIASEFIPALTEGLTKLSHWVSGFKDLVRHSNIVQAAVVAVGIALTAMLGGARLLALTKAGLLFALLALAIDEIITFAKGGDTVIGRLLDSFGGAGTAAALLSSLREAWQGLNAAFADSSAFVNFLLEDYFGQLYRDGANLAGQIERIGNLAVWAGEKLLRFFGINVAGAGKSFDPVTERATRGVGGEIIGREVDDTSARDVQRAAGRGVGAPLAATGVAAGRGMGATLMDVAGMPRPAIEAAALTRAGAAAAPVTVQQSVTVNVDGSAADARQVARMVEAKVRAAQAENNAATLRAVRQVPR